MKHTPGPWESGYGPYGWDDGIIQASVPVVFGQGAILTNSGHGGTSGSEDDLALLALAPTAPHECDILGCPGAENKRKLDAFSELLEACSETVNFLKTWKDVIVTNMTVDAWTEIYNQLEDAITKAEKKGGR